MAGASRRLEAKRMTPDQITFQVVPHGPGHREGSGSHVAVFGVDFVYASPSEVARGERAIAAVAVLRGIHREATESDDFYCIGCGETWPCLTVTALDEAGA